MNKKVMWAALIMGVGQVGAKVISLVYIYLLAKTLNDNLYLYTYAYIPFSLFLDIASLGLIPGTSKAVSSLSNEEERRSLLKQCSYAAIVVGFVYFIVFILFIKVVLTRYFNERIIQNLYFASYSILVFPMYTFFRGYLQGLLKAFPVALALIIENGLRVILFYNSVKYNIDLFKGIFFANLITYLSAIFVLFLFLAKDIHKSKIKFNSISYLYRIAIPFGFITIFFTIFQLIDAAELPFLGVNSSIYTAYMYKSIRLVFFPIVICQSVAGIISPRLNNLVESNNKAKAVTLAKSITTFMLSLIILLTYLFASYSRFIYSFFYDDNLSQVLMDTSIQIFFIGFYKVLIGIAQSSKRFNLIVSVTIISAIAKTMLNFFFVPSIGYRGGIISTSIALVICMCGAYYVLYKDNVFILKNNLFTMIYSVISLIVAVFYSTIMKLIIPGGITNIAFIVLVILFYLFNLSLIKYLRYLYTKDTPAA